MRILNLSNNYDLQGDLSDIVSPLKNLEELDLANNQAMTGDIKVLEACQKLIKLHLQKCKVSGKLFLGTFPVGLRTSPLFLWNFPFFGVTDSALPTLFSTSLPRGLMQASSRTSRCLGLCWSSTSATARRSTARTPSRCCRPCRGPRRSRSCGSLAPTSKVRRELSSSDCCLLYTSDAADE